MPKGIGLGIGATILMVAWIVGVIYHGVSTQQRTRASLDSISQGQPDESTYLDDYCRNYDLSLEDEKVEIASAIQQANLLLENGQIEGWGYANDSARSYVEAARLCGGHTVQHLGLTKDQLVGIGMLKYEVPKEEKP